VATITFTPYNSADTNASKRTIQYVLDGHGNPYDFTTRYVADGHGGKLYAAGYNVTADAELCALEMKLYKEKYRQYHSATRGTNDTKKNVEVIQLYLSFPYEEKLSQKELMQITDEFIRKVHLDHYPVLAVPHYNKDHYHVHLVIGCYSIDGSHKLPVNKETLYHFRRNMDYICAEHGLSIVEPQMPLLRDSKYTQFYNNVIENNLVPVIPRNHSKRKLHSRRKCSMQAAMNNKLIEKQLQEEWQRNKDDKKKQLQNYYTYPGAYLPYTHRPVQIYKYDDYGYERSVPELMLLLLGTIAMGYLNIEQHRPVKNKYQEAEQSIYIGKTSKTIQNTINAIEISKKYGIASEQEIMNYKNSIGNQMHHCKAMIAHQQLLLEQNLIEMEQLFPESQEYKNLVFANNIVQNRMSYQQSRLNNLKQEYRDMSWMGKTLQKEQFECELQSIRYIEKLREEKYKSVPVVEKFKSHTVYKHDQDKYLR